MDNCENSRRVVIEIPEEILGVITMVGRLEAKEWAKEHLKGLFSSPTAPAGQPVTEP